MARTHTLNGDTGELRKALARSFQSGHINFLIGSGGSIPAIPPAGQIEKAIADLFAAGNEAAGQSRMYDFLSGVQLPTNKLIAGEEDHSNSLTLNQYTNFLNTIETVLAERRTTLLPKQATVFTTNYDLFIEKAATRCAALQLNDGFSRIPSLENRMEFSSRNFFNTTYNTGVLYNYRVEIPCLNLIKLHGSLSWRKDKDKDDIVFEVAARQLLPTEKSQEAVQDFIGRYAVVLPQITKFRTTLMESTYYELLRIYANALDRENALLLAFGFSFNDEHIRDITKRALKNPTLRAIAFAYNEEDRARFTEIFDAFSNMEVVAPPQGEHIDFAKFNELLRGAAPNFGAAQ